MDDFLNNNQAENEEIETEEFSASETEEVAEVKQDFIGNPIEFTPVTPENNYKPMAKGLKIFCLVLAFLILLTGTTLAGYFMGLNSQTTITRKTVKVDLVEQPTDSKEMSAAKVYEMVDASVVGITIYNSDGNATQASGIVYTKDGYIITNDHIFSEIPNPKFKIHTNDGKEYNAIYVAGDTVSDLAVLKVDDVKLTPATFANSDDLYIGQNIVAIGRPSDAAADSSITRGIISATNRRVKNSSNYSARLIQTDCPINPGSSGGALVNMYGQVVGVTSSKITSVEYEGMNYAIPTTVMERIVAELISEGKVVSRAKLGITYVAIDSVTAEINNMEITGLQIATVSTDSDLYGKVAKGDIITQINDIDITNDDMVLDIIEEASAGDKITVTVITTENETKTFTVTLGANISESSYTTQSEINSDNESSNNETFDFPFGE